MASPPSWKCDTWSTSSTWVGGRAMSRVFEISGAGLESQDREEEELWVDDMIVPTGVDAVIWR